MYMYSRTTEKKETAITKKCNNTYLSFPNIGESPIITDAKADFTCWLGSITKSYSKTNHIDNKCYVALYVSLIGTTCCSIVHDLLYSHVYLAYVHVTLASTYMYTEL